MSLLFFVVDSVCLSVTNFKLILLFLFLDGIDPFWPPVLYDPSTKSCSSIFDLGR